MFGIVSGIQWVPPEFLMLAIINYYSYYLFLASDSGFCYSGDMKILSYYICFKRLFKEAYQVNNSSSG